MVAWLLAQIVENHQTRLSDLSGGLVDIFWQSYYENQIPAGHITVILVANDNNFSDLFSLIAFWEATKTRHVILHNLREKSADDLNFWWSYGNFNPLLSYMYLSLGRVLNLVLQPIPTARKKYSSC